MNWSGFYKLDWPERIEKLRVAGLLDDQQVAYMQAHYDAIGDQQVENYLYNFGVPTGILTDILIDGHHYTVPMTTEEPSVIAAANNGARMMNTGTGVQTNFPERLVRGQIVVTDLENPTVFIDDVKEQTQAILKLANDAYPSMLARGAGAKKLEFESLDATTVAVDLLVDPSEAMGANVVNTMAEAVAKSFSQRGYHVLMGILSNYATEAVISAKVAIPVDQLKTKQGQAGLSVAKAIAQASQIENLSPYRAVTANKGIMNGVEAVVLASGNDTRAINASMHAYASAHGQYRGLANWQLDSENTQLIGQISFPIMVGVVGGSIGIVPAVKINQALMDNPTAKQLSAIVAGVALAQNLAALRALVSTGIQAGHMSLQAKSLALQVGAELDEVPKLVDALQTADQMNQQTAKALLDQIRNEKDK
ncbi:hydroxymethylglutaryl-CoA reductase [Weissella uvarum]|uniref:hydroxymethylglutaryl-CoA reductase, degradative n=1 Tax=Weissella uvarum TaxID=1479233 RepID=UPI00195F9E85|nr:hydroxymethylglutaryl-CoA reductase, degradative [Weissella uvarum]MBM7616965.1 hydroxymethylglutaryl-CoA reductase [Weissella uvarum]MCM0594586.1 hydroxymethylglutaryl-CoA reductase, degradative [Weissella uvarum]